MAAEAQRANSGSREQGSVAGSRSKPSIERSAPIINNVADALEDAGSSLERLRILFGDALGELHALTSGLPDDGGTLPASFARRFYNNWIIFEVASGLLEDFERDLIAISERALAERRAAAK